MQGRDSGEVAHLVAAGDAGRRQYRSRLDALGGRKKPAFGDAAGDVVVFFGITKGAGHSATAGIDIDYFEEGIRERSALAGGRSPMAF